jgi:hypothetical protein
MYTNAKFSDSNVTVGVDVVAVSGHGNAKCGSGGASLSGSRNANVTAGDSGIAIGIWKPSATAGKDGLAVSMEGGKVTTSEGGISLVKSDGLVGPNYNRARSGKNGALILGYYDEDAGRDRFTVAYVGENSILPNTFYYADETGRPQRAATGKVATEDAKDALVPLSAEFRAKYRVTGGTLLAPAEGDATTADRSSELTVAVETSFVFDGATIYLLKTSSPEFESIGFAANLGGEEKGEDDPIPPPGYFEAAECYPNLSLHFKYPAAVGDKPWTFTEVQDSNPIELQMSVAGVGEKHTVLGKVYTGCVRYRGLYSDDSATFHIFKPGVGLIDFTYQTEDGVVLTHWEKVP